MLSFEDPREQAMAVQLPFKKNPEKEYVVFCGLGGQGTLATKTMKDMGIKNVKNIKGGMADWEKIK